MSEESRLFGRPGKQCAILAVTSKVNVPHKDRDLPAVAYAGEVLLDCLDVIDDSLSELGA